MREVRACVATFSAAAAGSDTVPQLLVQLTQCTSDYLTVTMF